jgi:hypothetical protein
MRQSRGREGVGHFHSMGDGSRPLGMRRLGSRRAGFLHFQFAELQGPRDPLLGECFESLVGGELLLHLRNKWRPNELGGALAASVTQLIEGTMFLRSDLWSAKTPSDFKTKLW